MPVDFPEAVNVGGLYGMNVEVLGGDKALTPGTDVLYQYFDPNGANRIITLDTASATLGDRFIIRHNGVWNVIHYLEVKQAAIVLDKIYAGAIKEFIFDGTNWISRGIGTGENDNKRFAVVIGNGADAHIQGVAIGHNACAYNQGIAIGYVAIGHTCGVGIGYYTEGNNYGIAIGWDADSNGKKFSIALGYYSETERTAETAININGYDTDQENNVVQGRWERELAGGAGATEIFCGGQTNERFTIRASSALAFRIKVVARDNVAGDVAMYTFEGVIKRDGANNTVMSVCNKVIVHEDDAAWDCDVTADDGNEAIIITCTGDGANITQWAAVMDGVETHF